MSDFKDRTTNLHQLADHSADWRMVMLSAAALIVGTGAALGAWVLLRLVSISTNLFWFGRLDAAPVEISGHGLGVAMVLVPAIGGLIVGLMARFGSDKIKGHGIPEAIEAILYGESRLSLKVAILKPISSAVSIGSGGPFGAEGPIIMTGGAIGSLFAQCLRLSAAERKTLLVAGAAAGMTGIFNAPIAAVLLSVELLLFEWKPRSFVPVVVATIVSYQWRPFLLGAGPVFPTASSMTVPGSWMWLALVMGVAIGLCAALLSYLLYRIEDLFDHLPIHWMWWPAIGGVAVGLGGLIDVHELGAGYANIQALLDGSFTLRIIVTLLVIKALVWLVALGSGTSGGVLAPLLIIGGALGCLFGHLGPSGLWAMLGMAAMMSGAMRAPLTAAMFVTELTGHFSALPLAIAASVSAYAASILVMRRSILTEKIARRGRHVLQEYAVDPLDFMQAGQIMTRDPVVVPGTMSVCETVEFFADRARHRSYPVVDDKGKLVGLVSRSDALRWRSEGYAGERSLADVLSDASQPFAHRDSPAGFVADMMVKTGVGRIPIVAPDTHKVVGILSRHDLLKIRGASQRSENERSRTADIP
jgi:H+/Cl- antiporter ClcA/CBS domain-containing protein